MTVLRVGIIGAGGIASGVHIPSYLNSGNKVEIVAIADVVVERAQEVAGHLRFLMYLLLIKKCLRT